MALEGRQWREKEALQITGSQGKKRGLSRNYSFKKKLQKLLKNGTKTKSRFFLIFVLSN